MKTVRKRLSGWLLAKLIWVQTMRAQPWTCIVLSCKTSFQSQSRQKCVEKFCLSNTKDNAGVKQNLNTTIKDFSSVCQSVHSQVSSLRRTFLFQKECDIFIFLWPIKSSTTLLLRHKELVLLSWNSIWTLYPSCQIQRFRQCWMSKVYYYVSWIKWRQYCRGLLQDN